MADAKEIKLKRRAARNLYAALQHTKRMEVSTRFRYWAKRNLDNMESDYNATSEAYLEKTVVDGKETWKPKSQEDFDKHLEEEVTLNLFPVDLPEIKETQMDLPPATRAQNEQIIFEWLLPIIKE